MGAPGPQPVSAAEPPSFTVTAVSAFLRAEPRIQSEATYSVFQGDVFPIVGRKADNTWYQLEYPKATKGAWILASLGKVTGDLGTVPVTAASSNTGAGTAGPPTPKAPVPTVPPAAPPVAGTPEPSEICVLLYNDANGNGGHDEGEAAIAGGQVTLLDPATGALVQTFTTVAREAEGHCFGNLPPGAYTVAASAPAGFNPTMEGSILQRTQAGQRYLLTFGAQPKASSSAVGQKPSATTNLLTGAGVALLLLAAVLIALFIVRRR
jgi:hypothetical protein